MIRRAGCYEGQRGCRLLGCQGWSVVRRAGLYEGQRGLQAIRMSGLECGMRGKLKR